MFLLNTKEAFKESMQRHSSTFPQGVHLQNVKLNIEKQVPHI